MSPTWFGATPGPIPYISRIPSHAAASATEEWPVFRAPFACKLKKLDIVPQAAVMGNDTNTTNLNIINKGSAGAGTIEVGNLDLIAGVNLVAFDSKNVPLNAIYLVSGVTLAEGDVLSIQHEKVGNGVLLPECHIYIEYDPA